MQIFHKISFHSNVVEKYKHEVDRVGESKKELNVISVNSGYEKIRMALDDTTPVLFKGDFVAFNEGVTESLASYAVALGRGSDMREYSYGKEVDMVENIRDNAYPVENGGMQKFLQEYFSGSPMVLRNIERFYGKGSLHLLSELETEKKLKRRYGDVPETLLSEREEVIEFFTTKDEERREGLRKKLLG